MIELYDPKAQEKAKAEIRTHVTKDTTWKYRELADDLYTWARIFNSELVYPIARVDKHDLPSPVIAFESMNIRVLAGYTLGKNAVGLDDTITFNTHHLEYPRYSLLETLAHEQVHLWQQRNGEHPYKGGRNTHNAEFVGRCEDIGLHPVPIQGWHYKPADGAFEALLARHGIAKPEFVEVKPEDKRCWWQPPERKPGRSTLTKWTCGCDPPQSARVGKQEFFASCPKCRQSFKKV